MDRVRDADGYVNFLSILGHRFSAQMASESGCSVLFNAIVVNDRFPEVHQAQLQRIAEHNAEGRRVLGQGLTTRMPARLTLEDWNYHNNEKKYRENN